MQNWISVGLCLIAAIIVCSVLEKKDENSPNVDRRSSKSLWLLLLLGVSFHLLLPLVTGDGQTNEVRSK